MSDYSRVSDALAAGATPAQLCGTCPWDRLCVTPPELTKDEIDRTKTETIAEMKKASPEDEASAGVMGQLLTTLFFSGKEREAQVCPVFVVRMRSSSGRVIADGIKAQMQGWDDDAV